MVVIQQLTPELEAQLKYKGEPSDEQFALIQKNSPQIFQKSDIHIYSVRVSDNLPDRQNDLFSLDALKDITSKLVGVTGIKDHEWSSGNQHSRIFDAILVEDTTQQNPLGEPYYFVVGLAYTLNNESNKELIQNIQAGILNEVSLGFNQGETETVTLPDYGDINIIRAVNDVLEFSFVAVPAQPKAGVIKSYNKTKEVEIMKPTDALLKVKSLQSFDQSAITSLETALKGFDEECISFEHMKARLKSLEQDVATKSAEVETLKQEQVDTQLNTAIEGLLGKHEFVSEVACGIARELAQKGIYIGEDGQVTGSEDVESLLSTDYKFLTKSVEESKEESVETKTANEEDESNISTKGVNPSATTSIKKHSALGIKPAIDFTRVTTKSQEQTIAGKIDKKQLLGLRG